MIETRPPHPRGAALGALCLFACLVSTAPAMALERAAWTMEILVDGVPLKEHAAPSATYVEAFAGREYSIRLRNNTAERVAVALSVDGLNTIDARSTTARDAAKWILDPYQAITLDGWQTGSSTARRFFFTTESNSYGEWLGRTRNLGIISAAVFRERRPRPAPIWKRTDPPAKAAPLPGGSRLESSPQEEGRAGAESDRQEGGAGIQPDRPDDYAATGIGREVGHSVARVQFDAQTAPAAVLDLRYEYRDALVRLGVLPRPWPPCDDPLTRRERARGFDGIEFAPDPYRPRRH